MLKPLTVAVAALNLAVPDAQLPGDRPAANPHATRSVVMARNGVVATSQPLASAAGLRVLQQGGNAIDAAVTAAAVLSVVEPTMNGVGGDLFAIVYDAKTRTVRGLNASGRAAAAATPESTAAESSTRFLIAASSRSAFRAWSTGGRSSCETRNDSACASDRAGDRLRARWLPGQRHRLGAVEGRSQDACAGSAAAATFLPDGRAPSAGEVFKTLASRRRWTRLRVAGVMRSTTGRSRRRLRPT